MRIKAIIFLISIISMHVFAQRINRLNKHGERVGKWITYIDDEKNIKSFEGKFRNGKPVGKSYFYTYDGKLDRREISRFKKLKTTFYYPNGIVKLTGNARLENLPDKIHYYFYGKWKAYNDSSILIRYDYYEKGKFVKSEYINNGNSINDSLIRLLRQVDSEFTIHNRSLTDSINAYKKGTTKKLQFKSDMRIKDSVSFAAIEKILLQYGYPSKQLVGEASDIPFYILGYAPVQLREKYINELILLVL